MLFNQFKSPILLILIFAAVRSIFLQEAADAIFWDTQPDLYKACLCNAQLRFANGFVAEAVYGKGEIFGSRKTFLPSTEQKKRWFLLLNSVN